MVRFASLPSTPHASFRRLRMHVCALDSTYGTFSDRTVSLFHLTHFFRWVRGHGFRLHLFPSSQVRTATVVRAPERSFVRARRKQDLRFAPLQEMCASEMAKPGLGPSLSVRISLGVCGSRGWGVEISSSPPLLFETRHEGKTKEGNEPQHAWMYHARRGNPGWTVHKKRTNIRGLMGQTMPSASMVRNQASSRGG